MALVTKRYGVVDRTPAQGGGAGLGSARAVAIAVVAGAVGSRAGYFGRAVGVVGVLAQAAEFEVDVAVSVFERVGVAAVAVADAAVERGIAFACSGMLRVPAGDIGLGLMAAVAGGGAAPARCVKYVRRAGAVVVDTADDVAVAVQVLAGAVAAWRGGRGIAGAARVLAAIQGGGGDG